MNRKALLSAAGMLALAAQTGYAAETLASWTFETGYAASSLGEGISKPQPTKGR